MDWKAVHQHFSVTKLRIECPSFVIVFFLLSQFFFSSWKKKYTIQLIFSLQNKYYHKCKRSKEKNLKLNGATILDLSKTNSCCKNHDGLLQIYLFMYDMCPTDQLTKTKEKVRYPLGKDTVYIFLNSVMQHLPGEKKKNHK